METTSETTTIPFRDSPGYKGNSVLALNTALIVTTTIIVGLRLYVRAFVTKALGLDDLLALLAFACATTQSAFDIRSVQYGSGAHVQYVPVELMPTFFSTLVNNTLICLVGAGLMRLSIVAFMRRLAKDLDSSMFFKSIYLIGLVIVGQTVGCFFYRLTECKPISHIWLVPDASLNCVTARQEQNNLIVHQSFGVLLDLALFALPIWILGTKMMKSTKRLQTMFVFSVGLFVVVTGIVRLVLMNTLLFLADPTYAMSTLGPWSDLETHTGLWVASFPALQPLLRSIPRVLDSMTKSGSQDQSVNRNLGQTQGHTKNLGESRSWVKASIRAKGYARNGSGVDTDNESEHGMNCSSTKSEIELDNLSAEHILIRKKVEYDVKIEAVDNNWNKGMEQVSIDKKRQSHIP